MPIDRNGEIYAGPPSGDHVEMSTEGAIVIVTSVKSDSVVETYAVGPFETEDAQRAFMRRVWIELFAEGDPRLTAALAAVDAWTRDSAGTVH